VTFGTEKFQVDVKEAGGGGCDLNVQLTLSGGKVNMSTAPDRIVKKSLDRNRNRADAHNSSLGNVHFLCLLADVFRFIYYRGHFQKVRRSLQKVENAGGQKVPV